MKYNALVKAIQTTTAQLQGRAAMAVNQTLVLRNWLVGEWILEFDHNGKDRAMYGDNLLDKLAADLKQSGLKGLDMRTLRDCRGLVRQYPQIRGTLPPEFLARPNSGDAVPRIAATMSPQFAEITSSGLIESSPPIRKTVSDGLPTPLSPQALLRLSWSHLQELIAIDDPWKRAFFENECLLFETLRLPLPRRPAIRRKTPPLPRSRPRTYRKPDAAAQDPQTRPAQTQERTPLMLLPPSIRNGTRPGGSPRSRGVDPVPLLLPFLPLITAHCPLITSSSQHDHIELLPLNPTYDPIPVAPHEGPEMVVVGEWVASID
jgi:hypothetical protein